MAGRATCSATGPLDTHSPVDSRCVPRRDGIRRGRGRKRARGGGAHRPGVVEQRLRLQVDRLPLPPKRGRSRRVHPGGRLRPRRLLLLPPPLLLHQLLVLVLITIRAVVGWAGHRSGVSRAECPHGRSGVEQAWEGRWHTRKHTRSTYRCPTQTPKKRQRTPRWPAHLLAAQTRPLPTHTAASARRARRERGFSP